MASASIDLNFNIGDTVFFVQSDVLKTGAVNSISISKTNSGVVKTYNVGPSVILAIPLNESDIFATAQEAAEAFSQKLLDAFEA